MHKLKHDGKEYVIDNGLLYEQQDNCRVYTDVQEGSELEKKLNTRVPAWNGNIRDNLYDGGFHNHYHNSFKGREQ